MLRGVIFDMDGVLVDSHPVHRMAWRLVLTSAGKVVTEEELDFILDGRKKSEILRHFFGDIDEAALAKYAREKDALFHANIEKVGTIPGVCEFLDQLEREGIPVAVATAASATRTGVLLERVGLKHRFRGIVTGDEVLNGKPDPEIYRRAGKVLHHDASELLVVEDAASGVAGAKDAGMRCLGIASGSRASQLRLAGADLVVESLSDVTLADIQELFATGVA